MMSSYFTGESLIFRKQLSRVDMTKPVNIMVDEDGNKLITDGNHRAYRSLQSGEPLREQVIGIFKGKITDNPDYHPVSELKLSEAEPPFSS